MSLLVKKISKSVRGSILLAFLMLEAAVGPTPAWAAGSGIDRIDLDGPVGSQYFALAQPLWTTVLDNGNVVVADWGWDSETTSDVGAVYLYNGVDGALISRLTGSIAGDQVGEHGIVELADSKFLVSSGSWDNGATANAGAVTWVAGDVGLTGTVSVTNSLVGVRANDGVGSGGSVLVGSGNYVVASPNWDNGAVANVGAATWGKADGTTIGAVSAGNSLIGVQANDRVGTYLTRLSNGNYLVRSTNWAIGGKSGVGAVTWGNGATGITGVVSVTNSIVGSSAADAVGSGVTTLTNGSYVLVTPNWKNGTAINAGAVTWGSGITSTAVIVSATNSLVGAQAWDKVGGDGVTALSNGNYVVCSSDWSNSGKPLAGAATWGSGTTGITGVVTATNSLVGSESGHEVCVNGVTALINGNYVVLSSFWDNGVLANVGAATWASGTIGISGVVSTTNSLVGSQPSDKVGRRAVPLTNGNYVVGSEDWANGMLGYVGAATWVAGSTGLTGVVSTTNSLYGTSGHDFVGKEIYALTNGNYVVASSAWDNGVYMNAGAATWGSGASGVKGPVSAANSLVGRDTEDYVSSGGIAALADGNYVVSSPSWDNGSDFDTGATTWGSGTSGVNGQVSADNSVIGDSAGDAVGEIHALDASDYALTVPSWDDPVAGMVNRGAVVWLRSDRAATGTVGGLVDLAVYGVDAGSGHAYSNQYVDVFSQLSNDRLVSRWQNDQKVVLLQALLQTFSVPTPTNGTITGSFGVCPTTCTYRGYYGDVLTMSASPATGYLFDGWSGECSGTGECSFSLTGTISITAAFSPEPALIALDTSAGPVSPSFISPTLAYTVATAHDVSTIVLTPTLSDPLATYTIQPISGTNNLVVGPNWITVTVTSQEGTQRNYVVVVTRAPSSDAALIGLAASTLLTPTFVSSTQLYSAAVPNLPGTVVFTPTLSEPNASYTIATASGPCAANLCSLNVGPNPVTITVLAQDGVTDIDYVVVVTRAPSDNATLGDIVLSSGVLTPVFAGTVYAYAMEVPYTASPVVITPTTGHPGASYTITTAAGPCVDFACDLNVGVNFVTVTVTAEDGVTTLDYVLQITRASISNDAALINLTMSGGVLSPNFVSSTLGYTSNVPFSVDSVVVTPTLSYPAAVYTITGPYGDCTQSACVIDPGVNMITVTVTAEDGVTMLEYVIEVVRAQSSDAALIDLAIAPGELAPTFVSSTLEYTARSQLAVTTMFITPTVSDPGAMYTITSSAGPCIAGECSIGSSVGPVTVTVIVQALDGSLVTYQIFINHVPPPPAIGTVWPRTGEARGGMPVSLLGSGFDGATSVLVNGAAVVSYTILSDGRIDFIMPAGVEGTSVDIEVIGPGGASLAAQTFSFVGASSGAVDGEIGGVVTTTSSVTVYVPAQGIIGRFIFTLTSEPPPIDPLGDLLMYSFRLQSSLNGMPLPSITNPVTIELYVDSTVVADGKTPYLYEYIGEAARYPGLSLRQFASGEVGYWFLVPNQTYVPALKKVIVPLTRMGRYAMSTLLLQRLYVPYSSWVFLSVVRRP